jgi:hypothetical protein
MRVSWLGPIVAGTALVVHAIGGQTQDAHSRVWISPGEMPKVQQAALLGDADAARRLAGNALVFGESDSGSEMRFWTDVGAENGDPTAQYNRGARLLCQADRRDRVRAEFWLARAKQAGHAEAARQLDLVRNGQNPCGLPRPE